MAAFWQVGLSYSGMPANNHMGEVRCKLDPLKEF